jgi:transposase InsO family protein
VLVLRDAHPTWGGRKLRRCLQNQGHDAPAASTCTAILRRHDRLDPDRPRTTPWQRFEHPAPNDLWQADFKHPHPLATGGRCLALSVLDDHARFLVGLIACADGQDATVRAAFTTLFQRYGLPWRILTDNGPPWGNPHPTQRLTALSFWLIRLGIGVSHGRPRHPQTQGKVERFHGTLQADLLQTTPLYDLAHAQGVFDTWRDDYNLIRPHEALALATPASQYQPKSVRPFPTSLPPIDYGPDDAVRVVHGGGQISFHGRFFFLSQALRGERVGVRPTTEDGVYTVHYCHQQVGSLNLRDPAVGVRPVDNIEAEV